MNDTFLQVQARLQMHLQTLVRERDPYLATTGHWLVQAYIREQFAQWGEVRVQEFRHRGQQQQNLILNLSGVDAAASVPILVGAHYDAVPGSPGADDNASGVAVLLELARAIALQPASYPIRLVAFDLEEWGMVGSHCYAAHLKQQQQRLRLMLSLEMLGYRDGRPGSQHYPWPLQYVYPRVGNFIGLIGNWPTGLDLLRLRHHLQPQGVPCQWLLAGARGQFLPAVRRSDHAPFWDQGYPAVMVTDTAEFRNPHYHQPSDRLTTLDLDFLTAICIGLTTALQHLP